MKKLFSFMSLLILSSTLFITSLSAQTPQGVNYQAVARDAGGNIMANTNICIQSTITNGNGGPELYRETFSTMTNQFGLFLIEMNLPVAWRIFLK